MTIKELKDMLVDMIEDPNGPSGYTDILVEVVHDSEVCQKDGLASDDVSRAYFDKKRKRFVLSNY